MQHHSVQPNKQKRREQKLPIASLALQATKDIEAAGPANCHVLISCSKSKSGHRDLARDMYISPLYRKSVLVADAWGIPYSILSAKYGLLEPDQTIEPYELTLKGASKQSKNDWADNVDKQIRMSPFAKKRLIVLAGDDYYAPLVEAGANDPLDFLVPMQGVSFGSRLTFLDQCIRIRKRRDAIKQSYELFAELVAVIGFHKLRDVLAEEIPKQGVYFFFDDSERTQLSNVVPRLVRIGTHGVSAGSTATLRNRLRTHLGTKSGAGNHRASVFRLHVGRALIERDGLQLLYPQWGKGQSASKDITQLETPLEAAVSKYIGDLRVLFIPVLDISGTGSMRATIERQFIHMFTESLCVLDESSPTWLGRFSDKPSIRNSGLWNVRDIGGEYDLRFIPLLESLIKTKLYRPASEN